MSKKVIVSGAYGVGKSEFVVQWALAHAPATIGDLDILNPFFRPREIEGYLNTQGVHVVSSHLKRGQNQDTPALSLAFQAAILKPEALILDCAGSENGLKPLAALSPDMADAEFWMVVNLNRPESALDQLDAMRTQFEAMTQRRLTGLVHNTHLLDETTAESISTAQQLLESYALKAHLPIVCTMVPLSCLKDCEDDIHNPILAFDTLYLREAWMKGNTL